MSRPSLAAFDREADGYDAGFTDTRLGRWLRDMVQTRLAAAFPPGSCVLELGCGTGEDAVFLARRGVRMLATDASPRMVQVASAKAARADVADRVTGLALRAEDLAALAAFAPAFDGAYSNFGALNCVADLGGVARDLARLVRPGGRIVLVVMGPSCAWETAWYLAHGDPKTALRRLTPGGVATTIGGRPLAIYYPSPAVVARAFAPAFAVTRVEAVGALLPPSTLSHLVDRWPRTFARVAAADRRLARSRLLVALSDHYLLELEKEV